MKLIITIVQAYDSDRFLRAVTDAGFGATKINSVGGFLRMVNSTVLIATDKERIPEAIRLIRQTAQRRVEVKMDAAEAEYSDWISAGLHDVEVGGAVVFVMPMDALYRIWPDRIEKHVKTAPFDDAVGELS